jgi:hypothetical protein
MGQRAYVGVRIRYDRLRRFSRQLKSRKSIEARDGTYRTAGERSQASGLRPEADFRTLR